MLDKITNPDKFIDAEKVGSTWISDQKKEYKGFKEVVRSFFSLKSTFHNPITNIVLKYGGLSLAGGSIYSAKFVENTNDPLVIGGILLTWGVAGVGTTIMGTMDSMSQRIIERKRKLEKTKS